MKKVVLFLLFLSVSMVYAQQKEVLLSIDDEKITVNEFKRVYEKNLDAIIDENDKDIDKYLDLFINYKLKVKLARAFKMDTLRSYKRDMQTYRNQLAAPYLQDKEFKEKLIKEAYFRTKNEIRASHILVKLPNKPTPKDTLEAYNKIIEIRNQIINGGSFKEVAKETSEDPSVKINGGDLGYFSAFRMVYPFEDMAYKTKVGKVSMPFRTRFGYHLVKTVDMRPSKGKVKVAHILLSGNFDKSKKRIDSIYNKLRLGADFKALAKQFSDDRGSKNKGGVLPKFGSGTMEEIFETTAFSLQKQGEISNPIKTRYGWHIVKLIKKIPVGTYEQLHSSLERKVKSNERNRLSDKAVVNRLRKKYKISVNEQAKKKFLNTTQREFPKEQMQEVILTIEDKDFTQEEFSNYIKVRRHLPVEHLVERFIDQELIEYFKDDLVNIEPNYKYTLQEYKEGMLLFELMQQKVWNKSAKDTLGLETFFNKNKSKYKSKDLSVVRGEVMNDYQKELEDKLIATIRKRTKIKLNKHALKKFKKAYNQ